MKITCLGHAGFYVETESTVLMFDPWLSPGGAFDAAWFQYPKNTHLFNDVLQQFETTPKDKLIFISHEHKDHFDVAFLTSIKKRNFKIILANFRRSVVKETLLSIDYQCEEVVSLSDEEAFIFQDGWLRLFIVDAELDCDSSILLKVGSGCFLNVNDCKIYDKLANISKTYGPIDVFASQFSGAIWHPVCYDLPKEEYENISYQKKMNKFKAVSTAIETINPAVFLPSAGPPCFLDPMLIHINFEPENIFPRAPQFIKYLNTHCKAANTMWSDIMPGDILDVESSHFIHLAEHRVQETHFDQYIKDYAFEYKDYFIKRDKENQTVSPERVFVGLRKDLEKKMRHMNIVNLKITACLYWRISD